MATIVNTASSPRLLSVDVRPVPSADDRTARAAYAKGKPDVRELRLEVGANTVADELWLDFCSNPFVAALRDAGTLVELDDPKASEEFKPGKRVVDLSALKEDDALKAIEACRTEKQLRTWIEQDPRKKIRKALVSRHRVLVPPPKQEADVTPLHEV